MSTYSVRGGIETGVCERQRVSISQQMTIEPLRVSVEEAARIIGVSRSVIYKHMKAGTLRAVKDGTRTLFTMTELRGYVFRTDSTHDASTTNS
jgi:excisionase family DNA binding protein